jgi:hypothetical protein
MIDLCDSSYGLDICTELDDACKDVHNYYKKSYAKEIKKIYEATKDKAVKYLLIAIMEEVEGNVECIKNYKKAVKHGCKIALYKLALLYEGQDLCRTKARIVPYDSKKALNYYFEYYKENCELNAFAEIYFDSNYVSASCSEFMDMYDELNTEKNKLKRENKMLKKRITELEYMPGGVGYDESKKHFDTLVRENMK